MPPRRTTPRYSLYRNFVDAYMKAHADKPRSVREELDESLLNSLSLDFPCRCSNGME